MEKGHLLYTEPDLSRAQGKGRGDMSGFPSKERTLTCEVESRLTAEAALQEAERCLSCGRAAEVKSDLLVLSTL